MRTATLSWPRVSTNSDFQTKTCNLFTPGVFFQHDSASESDNVSDIVLGKISILWICSAILLFDWVITQDQVHSSTSDISQ